MRSLSRPTITAEESFNACISGVMDRDLRERLQNIKPHILAASENYERAGVVQQLHTVVPVIQGQKVAGIITVEEMIGCYNNRMVKAELGRKIYDKLRS